MHMTSRGKVPLTAWCATSSRVVSRITTKAAHRYAPEGAGRGADGGQRVRLRRGRRGGGQGAACSGGAAGEGAGPHGRSLWVLYVRARSADVLQCGSPWARAVKCGPFAQSKLLQRCATGPRDTSGSDANPRATRVDAPAALSYIVCDKGVRRWCPVGETRRRRRSLLDTWNYLLNKMRPCLLVQRGH